jgi:hypothetical protein
MPILNAAFSTWDEARICIPTPPDLTSPNPVPIWDFNSNLQSVLVSDFSVKQVSTMSVAPDVAKGSVYGSLWDIGDTMWEVSFTTPMLVSQDADDITDDASFPWCASLPVSSPADADGQVSTMLWNFINTCTRPNYPAMAFPTDFFRSHWGTDGSFDGVVRNVTINVTEGDASMSVSIISTVDPRSFFHVMSNANIADMTYAWRTIKPWDLEAPGVDGISPYACIGCPMNYQQTSVPVAGGGQGGDVPTRLYNPSDDEWGTADDGMGGGMGLLREWSLRVDTDVQNFRSVGTGTSRPFLAIRSVRCEGSISYIPLVRTTDANQNDVIRFTPDLPEGSFLSPSGWMVDAQALDGVERYGGQLYVSGQPPYSGTNQDPLWPGLMARRGTPDGAFWLVDPKGLGPIMVAEAGLTSKGGSTNAIKVNFKTSVGVETFPPQIPAPLP